MTLRERISDDMKSAMRAKDTFRLNVLRFAKAEIAKKEDKKEELSDQAIVKMFKKNISVLNENIENFRKQDQTDDVKERIQDAEAEIRVLEAYLPEEMSEADTRSMIQRVIDQNQEKVEEYKSGNKALTGFFMGQCMKESQNAADPKLVGNLLKEMLA
jgi:uncharacterized protein YqeY